MPVFSQELFDTICERIADGESLRGICRDDDMPNTKTVMRWLNAEENEALRQQYARARTLSADADADDVKDIATRTLAGEFDPGAARVAIDAYKWSAGKRKPKVYGDKILHGNDPDAPFEPISVVERVIVKSDAKAD